MTIYFEDGKLIENNDIPAPGYCFIDAACGPSTCEYRLRWEQKDERELYMASVVYTNYLGAMDGTYSWDADKGYHDLYLRDKEGKWRLIQTFTEKELRMPHKIPHMYIAGTFAEDDDTDKTCKDCAHFIGCGDWDLCCTQSHDGYPFGFLCYEDTPACDKFSEKTGDDNVTN